MDWITIAFLLVGLGLIASEALFLSLVQVFLGLAALGVAALRAAGILEDLPLSVLTWAFLSLGMTLPLRPLARRWFPVGERKVDHSHEDKDAYGVVVEVVDEVRDDASTGRIRFQGTVWSALSTDGVIAAGQQARIVYRDKLVWVVEPVLQLDGADVVPALSDAATAAVAEPHTEPLKTER